MKLERFISALFMVFFMIFDCGCTYPKSSKGTLASKASILAANSDYYSYPSYNYKVMRQTLKKSKKFSLETIQLPLMLPEELKAYWDLCGTHSEKKPDEMISRRGADENLLAINHLDIYRPIQRGENDTFPAILISPILGGNTIVNHFARYYVKRGFISVVIHRKEIFWDESKGIEQLENYLRTSVIRLRQALDWLIQQPEVDEQNIGAFGISYGAILHSMFASIDQRVKYHILAMPAAPLADVIISCPDKGISDLIPLAQKTYGDTLPELHQRLRGNIKTDPILLASKVEPEKILMYIALFDRVVGVKNSFKLWKAFGKPRLKILPFGHYGGILILPILQYQTYKVFKKRLQ